MKDGWYYTQYANERYWVYYKCGTLVLGCSENFRYQMLNHPKLTEMLVKEVKIYNNGKEVQ